MNSEIHKYLNKNDFKRYKICSKLALINSSDKNKKSFLNLVKNNKISFNKKHIDISNLIIETNNLKGKHSEEGIKVGKIAQKFFEIQNNNKCKNFDIYTQQIAIKKTLEYLNNEKYNVFFEPVFQYNDLITKCDVLKKFLNGWEIIEVKAITEIKLEHLHDLIFQYYVLKKLGLKIYNLKLMYLNKNYKFDFELNLNSLFIFEDEFKIQREKQLIINIANEYINSNLEHDLFNLNNIIFNKKIDFENFLLKKYCSNDNKNYCTHVFQNIPEKDTIFNLYNLRFDVKMKFFYDENILYLKDINLNKKYFYNFSSNQIIQILVIQNKKDILINPEYLKKNLSNYKYPIYMYDFETFQLAIPRYNYTISYQQIPFQYSVHILNNKNFDYKINKNINHFYFLATGDDDPRINLINKLTQDYFYEGKGIYVSYNKSFEIKILREAIQFIEYDMNNNIKNFINHKKLIDKIKYIIHNTIDLMDFFFTNTTPKSFVIYKKEFNGSLSIKNTLPAFDKNFSYKHLKIQKGNVASENFWYRVHNIITLEKWDQNYRQNMIDYCNQDTFGMIILLKKILNLLNKKNIEY